MTATIEKQEEENPLAKWAAVRGNWSAQPIRPKRGVKRRLARLPYAITLAIVLAVGTPLFAWMIAEDQPLVYAARAEVLANNTSDAPNGTQFAAAVATQRVVMRSRAVVEPVAAQHGLEVDDLEEALTVEELTGSTVLQVTVEDEDPDMALAVVHSIVETYLGLVPVTTNDPAMELLLAEIADLETEQAEVEDELLSIEANNAQARATGAPVENPTRERRLIAQSEELGRRISNVEDRLSVLAVEDLENQDSETSPLVSAPFVLPDPVSPDPVRAAALGALGGIALGGTLLLVWAQSLPARREAAIPGPGDQR